MPIGWFGWGNSSLCFDPYSPFHKVILSDNGCFHTSPTPQRESGSEDIWTAFAYQSLLLLY